VSRLGIVAELLSSRLRTSAGLVAPGKATLMQGVAETSPLMNAGPPKLLTEKGGHVVAFSVRDTIHMVIRPVLYLQKISREQAAFPTAQYYTEVGGARWGYNWTAGLPFTCPQLSPITPCIRSMSLIPTSHLPPPNAPQQLSAPFFF
jgi:hypothetical protein